MSDAYRTNRWRGVVVLTLAAAGVGLLAKRPLLLLVSTVGVVYAVYPRLSTVWEPRLELTRHVSEANPRAGSQVEVTTTIRNVGARPLVDLRFVDGVPPALPVTEGSPRLGTALRPGETADVSYTMAAERGQHRFEAATALARDFSGDHEVEITVETETAVDVTSDLDTAPVSSPMRAVAGQTPASSGGSGTEFYQTRSYRRGDPLGRVDWNRYARTGELTTVEFRAERTASVVVLVDTTPSAYRGREGEPHAVVVSAGAAQLLVRAVLDGHDHVGLGSLGTVDCWLAPDTGRRHRLRAEELLAGFDSRRPDPERDVDVSEQVSTLLTRLTEGTQLLVVSPLLADDLLDAVLRLAADDHDVTVVSPDVTVDDAGSEGRRLATVERAARLRTLRHADVRVVDWPTADPLSVTLHRQQEAAYG